jgi:hypothetical protein
MPDAQTQELISQVTLRKLAFVRGLLRDHELPTSGTRDRLVQRLSQAVDEGRISPDAIQSLLNELDAWGDQRVKLAVLEPRFLALYRNTAEIDARIHEAGMEHLVGRDEIDINPPDALTPMSVEYTDHGEERLLRVVAAKTRLVERPARELPELDLELHPIGNGGNGERADGIFYKPFRRERQKAISFAEVNLTTGSVLISTTLLRYSMNYRLEYEELLSVFERLIPLGAAIPLLLYRAVHQIKHLPHDHVRIYSRKTRSPVGGSVDLRSHSSKTDLRTDAVLMGADALFGADDGTHCNCRWQPINGLSEEVHTHLFAPAGEISVVGQVTEPSVRHVLQRIRALN